MASQRVDTGTGSWCPYSVGKWHPGAARSRRGRRVFCWLAAASLLAHGWLPVLLQASLAEHQGGARQGQNGHLTHEDAATVPDLSRSDHRQKCPIFHDPICLCAIFVSFLMPANGPVPAPGVARSARTRGADHQSTAASPARFLRRPGTAASPLI
jgi:hypothetical protein